MAFISITTGYVEAAVIPKGARSITVRESKPCTSFLGEVLLYLDKQMEINIIIMMSTSSYNMFVQVMITSGGLRSQSLRNYN